MKNQIACLMLLLGLAGCKAHMMETQGDSIRAWDPMGKQTRGGVIRYLNTGLSSWRKARRFDAENQMKTYCQAPYKIIAEGPRSQFGADMPIGKSVSVELDEYWYVRFACEEKN